jgi:polygalacturonase
MQRREFLSMAAAVRDVTGFGASGDGKRNNRDAIQRAIDECAAAGGGAVRIPPGRFRSGALRLKSGVALYLDHGAMLMASDRLEDYPVRRPTPRVPPDHWGSAFLLAEGAERVAILGPGVICGAGLAKPRPPGGRLEPFRPRLVAFEKCKDVAVDGVTLRDSDRWTLHFYHCDHVRAGGLRIQAAYDITNTDGIDIDGCRNVVISGCEIVTGDDCIVLKTTNYLGEPRAMENVTVSNCVLSTRASAFKVGTETHADIQNITFANSVVYGTGQVRPQCAVELASVDGARLGCISVSNITARAVAAAVFLRLGARTRPPEGAPPARLHDVVLQNLVATGCDVASSIAGIPGLDVENVTLSDFRLVYIGGGGPELAKRSPPEKESSYPKPTMFGPLPAAGLYLRHARGIVVRNLDVSCLGSDARPTLVVDDVKNLSVEGLRRDGKPAPEKF